MAEQSLFPHMNAQLLLYLFDVCGMDKEKLLVENHVSLEWFRICHLSTAVFSIKRNGREFCHYPWSLKSNSKLNSMM